jgi:phosphatidylserine/phosphatidylglycerophosphate/cardiolipin synthase-like enzyme/uncharacterized membrane protein YdjX (TVP38/TMEM64 family)
MIYAMERELFPYFKPYWHCCDRLNFSLDGEHPIGASQHQKIVVIDDCLAFSGGLDLTKCRWDTSEHFAEDDRRTDPEGNLYPPFHDVHFVVEGEPANALGELARERWVRAGNSAPVALSESASADNWPASVKPALKNIKIGIARTFPEYNNQKEIREVETLYIDSIRAAKNFIYIENQYLSSEIIKNTLIKKLEEEQGPEIIIVLPEKITGWLEHNTMDVIRSKLLKALTDADKHHRLRIFYVRLSQKPHLSLMIHGKVMIIDDRFARVASSNLSNRSMGLDSECDLAIESTDSEPCTAQIKRFRQTLIAEHLDKTIDEVTKAEHEKNSLSEAIESLQGNNHSFIELDFDPNPDIEIYVPDTNLLDPEKPVKPEEFFAQVFSSDKPPGAFKFWLKSGIFLLALLIMITIWHATPASEYLNPKKLVIVGNWLDKQPMTPVLVICGYMLASFFAVPITILIVATISVFGAWYGSLYAMAGAELSAITSFLSGRFLGKKFINSFIGSQYNRLGRTLSRNGMLMTITLRIIPVAPFSVINLVAGISKIKFMDFAIGNFIGILPGIISGSLLIDQFLKLIKQQQIGTFVVLILSVIVIIPLFLGFKYFLKKKNTQFFK